MPHSGKNNNKRMIICTWVEFLLATVDHILLDLPRLLNVPLVKGLHLIPKMDYRKKTKNTSLHNYTIMTNDHNNPVCHTGQYQMLF